MFKKIIQKKGKIGLGVILFLIILFLFFMPFLSSLFSFEKKYIVGGELKFDFRFKEEYTLKIVTPTKTLMKEGNGDVFVFKLEEIGKYNVKISFSEETEEYGFEVKGEEVGSQGEDVGCLKSDIGNRNSDVRCRGEK